MDKDKLKAKVKEFLEIIKRDGVGEIFEHYDANDNEAQYLKTKLLSQLHINGTTYPDSEEFKAFIENAPYKYSFLESQSDLKMHQNIYRIDDSDYDKISEYYSLQCQLKYYQGINEEYLKNFEYVPHKPLQDASKETKKKYKQHYKELDKLQKTAPKLAKKIEEKLAKIQMSDIIVKYPKECNYIEKMIKSRFTDDMFFYLAAILDWTLTIKRLPNF